MGTYTAVPHPSSTTKQIGPISVEHNWHAPLLNWSNLEGMLSWWFAAAFLVARTARLVSRNDSANNFEDYPILGVERILSPNLPDKPSLNSLPHLRKMRPFRLE